MTRICEEVSISLSLNQCTRQTTSLVLQRRRFHHALWSGRKVDVSSGSTKQGQHSDLNQRQIFETDDEMPYLEDVPMLVKRRRKDRMRDKCGNLVLQKHKSRATSFTQVTKNYKKVTCNVKSLKLGTLTRILKGPVTFSMDFIELPNKALLEVSALTRCELCTAHLLPAMFLQITAEAFDHLTNQLAFFTDKGAEEKFKSIYQEGKCVLVFESEPTMLEKFKLEEIFTEIGNLKNINNFLVKLSFEEANKKLREYNCPRRKEFLPEVQECLKELETLSVSESEDEHTEKIDFTCFLTEPSKKLLIYPPPPAKGGFSITEEDLYCLNEGQFLNDVIIDFYLKYLVCENMDADRFHVFSSFFYKSLTQEDIKEQTGITSLSIQEKRHARVKTWTKHFDIFEKDFIFVPINRSAHWYLAVICFPGQAFQNSIMDHCRSCKKKNSTKLTCSSCLPNPMSLFYEQPESKFLRWYPSSGKLDDAFCFISDEDLEDEVENNATTRDLLEMCNIPFKQSCILLMDSLGCGPKKSVVTVLREYLEVEWSVKKGSCSRLTKRAMRGWSVQVPQQDNHTDCGLYLLQYVESFIKNPPQFFHPDMDLSMWFPQNLVKKKREQIKRLIFRLHHQQCDDGF